MVLGFTRGSSLYFALQIMTIILLRSCIRQVYPVGEFAGPVDMDHNFAHLLPPSWTSQVDAWLAEDTPSFDYAGYVVGEVEREAFLFGKGKQTAVLAGVPFFTEVFRQLECQYVTLLSLSFDNHRQISQGRMAHARRRVI
jgi:hypothetical protein